LEGIMGEMSFEEVWSFLPRHTAPAVRQAAIKRLAYFQGEHINNFLVSTCLAAEPPHYLLAMEAIERNPTVPAEDIKSILEWGPPDLYLPAFRVYISRVGPEGVETLIENLKHPEAAVRTLAVRGLFRLFGSKMTPVVTPLLADPDPAVCNAVLDAIADAPGQMIEEPLILAATRGPAEARRRALNLAAKKGLCTPELMAGYLAFLDEALKDPRPEGRTLDAICDTLEALKKTQSPYLVVSLVYAGRSASPRLRRVAMAALAEYPPEVRLEAFTYLDNTTDMSVVTKIAFDLAEHGHPAAVVPLIRVAMGRKQDDAKRARQYLNKMPEMKNIEKICELVRSKHAAVKQYAIDRLKEMGDPRAVAMLLQAIEEGNEEMQRIALARLAELGNVAAQEMQEEAQHGGLDKAKIKASRESIEELGQQADPRAVDILLNASADEDELVQLSAVEALGKFVSEERVAKRLIELVGYGGIGVRQKAVEILGKNKVRMAIDALIAALNNIFLRTYAEEALRAIGDRRGYLAIMRRRRREKMFPSRAKLERERRKREEAKKMAARV
ncbi:MAG: HEAT repeat domain-containing protein, partial [Planctomycetota bacterium]|nr:HEAT repeat domain-containing protein [Planctomycetota bacterium]